MKISIGAGIGLLLAMGSASLAQAQDATWHEPVAAAPVAAAPVAEVPVSAPAKAAGAPLRQKQARGHRAGRALSAGPQESRYHDQIARHAAEQGIPVSLADAVVRIESRYNASVVHAGNYGLMQIRPQTARGIGFSGSPSALLDPDTNLRYGMKYLAMAYHDAHGDTCRTLMRYQSGIATTRMSGANRAYCAKALGIIASR